jgi:hypothetical protein
VSRRIQPDGSTRRLPDTKDVATTMTSWTFTLILNRQITPVEADTLDVSDVPLFATGAVSYVIGEPGVEVRP